MPPIQTFLLSLPQPCHITSAGPICPVPGRLAHAWGTTGAPLVLLGFLGMDESGLDLWFLFL